MTLGGEMPLLRGERLVLRAPQPSDVVRRLELGRDPEFRRMVGATPASSPLSPDDAARWCERLTRERFGWAIEHEGRLIGEIRLHGVDAATRRARLAIGLFAAADRGHGLGTEAVRLVLGYAFEQLGITAVGLRVLAFNARALACYHRCGFREVGREVVRVGEELAEDVLMEVTAMDVPPDTGTTA